LSPFIEWQSVSRTYGRASAVGDFTLEMAEGEVLALLGPSGSGKSTLLRLTAGLEEPSAGRILLQGHDMAGTPAHVRRFGLMFQEYCLFPHMDVQRNVDFGLRMLHTGQAERNRRVDEMLGLVRMQGMGHRDVISLSGGEQQRVALARSLAPSPRLLMLDEPLGALDVALRQSLLTELSEILSGVGVTTLYVTHDQAEAMTIASRIALMREGSLVQAGTPEELMSNPVSAFAASFLGLGTLVPGTWGKGTERGAFITGLGRFAPTDVGGSRASSADKGTAMLLVPPEALSRTPGAGLRQLRCRVESRIPRPVGAILRIAMRGGSGGGSYPAELALSNARADPADSWQPGDETVLWLDSSRCRILPV
jgi:ABC-type Fe3+/spermidine/putrescine transport system ATPase subunit